VHNSRRHIPLLPFFAVVALLLLQTTAAAHELEHALEQHDEPACALHLYNGHAGKPAVADTGAPLVIVVAVYTPVSAKTVSDAPRLLAYRGRAPPRPLPNSI